MTEPTRQWKPEDYVGNVTSSGYDVRHEYVRFKNLIPDVQEALTRSAEGEAWKERWNQLRHWATERSLHYDRLKTVHDFDRVLEMMSELETQAAKVDKDSRAV